MQRNPGADALPDRHAAKAGRETRVFRRPSASRDDGAESDGFRSHTLLGRCDRPENPAQGLGNIESAPGNLRSVRARRSKGVDVLPDRHAAKARRKAGVFRRPSASRDTRVRADGSWPRCQLGRRQRPENPAQAFENIGSAPEDFGLSSRAVRRTTRRSGGRGRSTPCWIAAPPPGPSRSVRRQPVMRMSNAGAVPTRRAS